MEIPVALGCVFMIYFKNVNSLFTDILNSKLFMGNEKWGVYIDCSH